jgi:hypothetical protein
MLGSHFAHDFSRRLLLAFLVRLVLHLKARFPFKEFRFQASVAKMSPFFLSFFVQML